MAAMLAKGSRSLPRFFQRFSLISNTIWKGKGDSALRKCHHLSGIGQCSRLKNISGSTLLQDLKSPSSTSFRIFHRSAVACDEIKIVKTPPFAESITEGDVMWKKDVGDFVAEDEVVAEIETDKTSIDVPSPAAGVIEELLIPDGEKVLAGQEIFKLRLSGDAPPKKDVQPEQKVEPPKEAPTPPPTPAAPSSGPIPTQPPPVPPIPQTPVSSTPASSVKPVAAKAAAQPADGVVKGIRTERRVKMPRIRLRTSERLKESQNTCASLTTFNEIDMGNVIELRNKHKDAFLKKHGLKLGFMSAFVKASAYALQDQPAVNAVIDGAEIVYRDYIDISVAVATPKGLVVPVLRDVGDMNYANIEKGIAELGEKARSMSLAIEDMDGGTFTISNGGVYGSLYGTPIINLPQSAILGMHAIKDRPMVVNGKIEIRPMMYVALTYDHRLIDGREAVTFLNKIKSAVEDPRVLLLDL